MRWARCIVVVLAGLGAGATCGPGDPSDPCDGCAPELCFEVSGAGTTVTRLGCATPCGAGLPPCPDGRACTTVGTSSLCDPRCSSALCPERSECSTVDPLAASCVEVECGFFTACLGTARICDAQSRACYPENGSCATLADCPKFDGRSAAAGAELACVEGFCRLRPAPLPLLPGLDRGRRVELSSPEAGSSYESASAVKVEWSREPGEAAVVLVLSDVPVSRSELASRTVCGIAVGAEEEPWVTLDRCRRIRDGQWMEETVALALGVPLHVVVELVTLDGLVGTSRIVPVQIQGGWREPGADCGSALAIPGPCYHPARPQACVDGRCRVLCASHQDCAAYGLACSQPAGGLHRTCR